MAAIVPATRTVIPGFNNDGAGANDVEASADGGVTAGMLSLVQFYLAVDRISIGHFRFRNFLPKKTTTLTAATGMIFLVTKSLT